jgi:vacuolar iron transporter family protein
VVIFGGLAELTAGAISMGLGGYLAAKGEAEAHQAMVSTTKRTVREQPEEVDHAVRNLFADFDLPSELLNTINYHVAQSKSTKRVDLRLQHGEGAAAEDHSRAFTSAITIALGYFLGGLTPLLPYLIVPSTNLAQAFWASVGVMIVALFTFGAVKTVLVGGVEGRAASKWVRAGVEMVVLGGVAAGASMALVRGFGGE